jgi:hypothetical protein
MIHTVFIVYDNCPTEFNNPSIVAVYSTRKSAQEFIKLKKIGDAYAHQYLKIIVKKVTP